MEIDLMPSSSRRFHDSRYLTKKETENMFSDQNDGKARMVHHGQGSGFSAEDEILLHKWMVKAATELDPNAMRPIDNPTAEVFPTGSLPAVTSMTPTISPETLSGAGMKPTSDSGTKTDIPQSMVAPSTRYGWMFGIGSALAYTVFESAPLAIVLAGTAGYFWLFYS